MNILLVFAFVVAEYANTGMPGKKIAWQRIIKVYGLQAIGVEVVFGLILYFSDITN